MVMLLTGVKVIKFGMIDDLIEWSEDKQRDASICSLLVILPLEVLHTR
jgi:hypothetical protein